MNKRLILVATVILVAALLFGTPYGLGLVADTNLHDSVASLDESPLYDIEILDYEKGWFFSSARLEVNLDDDYVDQILAQTGDDTSPEAEALRGFMNRRFAMIVNTVHGPFVVQDGIHVGLFRSVIRFDPDVESVLKLEERLGVSPVVEISNLLGLDGTLHSKLVVPAFELTENENRLTFSGLVLDSVFEEGDKLTMQGNADAIQFRSAEGGVITAGDLSLEGAHRLLMPTLWIGSGNFHIARANVTTGTGDTLEMRNGGVNFSSTLTDNERNLDISTEYYLDKFQAPAANVNVSDASLSIGIFGIPVAILASYSELIQQSITNPGEETLLAEWRKMFDTLLRASPGLEIGPLRLVSDDRTVKARVRLDVNGNRVPPDGTSALKDYSDWMTIVSGRGQTEIAKPIANDLAVDYVKGQLRKTIDPAQRAEMSTQIDTIAQQQGPLVLDSLVDQGLIRELEDVYATSFTIDGGALTINGSSMPLAQP